MYPEVSCRLESPCRAVCSLVHLECTLILHQSGFLLGVRGWKHLCSCASISFLSQDRVTFYQRSLRTYPPANILSSNNYFLHSYHFSSSDYVSSSSPLDFHQSQVWLHPLLLCLEWFLQFQAWCQLLSLHLDPHMLPGMSHLPEEVTRT